MTFCFGLYQDLVNLLWKIIIYFSKKCFSFMILKELISLKHRFSKHFVNNKYLIQKSFITLYLSNIIAICDWKQFYLFQNQKIKMFINILVQPIYVPSHHTEHVKLHFILFLVSIRIYFILFEVVMAIISSQCQL